jgi:hypothetical protein
MTGCHAAGYRSGANTSFFIFSLDIFSNNLEVEVIGKFPEIGYE